MSYTSLSLKSTWLKSFRFPEHFIWLSELLIIVCISNEKTYTSVY